MAKPGPHPVPSNILRARGSWRGFARDDVQGPEGTPVCPEHLSLTAKDFWAEIVPQLEAMGVLSTIDAAALEVYCEARAQYREAMKTIAVEGLTVGTLHGKAAHPCVAIAREAGRTMNQIGGKFGWTPSDRCSIKPAAQPEKHDDDKERFFKTA